MLSRPPILLFSSYPTDLISPDFLVVLWGSVVGFLRLSSVIVMGANVYALMVSKLSAPVLSSPMVLVNYQPDMSWTPQIGYGQAELLKVSFL